MKTLELAKQPIPFRPPSSSKGGAQTEADHFGEVEVLVLEDEPISRALIEKYLLSLPRIMSEEGGFYPSEGLKILSLESGWDLLSTRLNKLRVAIVDILLPQVNGVDFINHLRKNYPQVGIVPISGMATEPMKRQLHQILPDGIQLIEKPLRKEQFELGLRKAIAMAHLNPAFALGTVVSTPISTTVVNFNSLSNTKQEPLWFESKAVTRETAVTVHRRKVRKAS